MIQCSFEKEETLEDGGLLRLACFNKAEILFVNDPCYGLCYACAYRKLQAENKRLREALSEWMLHHYGLEASDKVAGLSHSCMYCWGRSCVALKIKNSDDSVREYLEKVFNMNGYIKQE